MRTAIDHGKFGVSLTDRGSPQTHPLARREGFTRMIAEPDRSPVSIRMSDIVLRLDLPTFFTPAGCGYNLFARGLSNGKATWHERISARAGST